MARTLSVKQAAEVAGVSERTIRNRIYAGEIRALKKDGKFGPTYFIPESEVMRSAATDAELQPTVSAPVAAPSPAPTRQGVDPEFAGVLMDLTNQIREQAEAIGRFKALAERSESSEAEAAALRRELEQQAAQRAALEARVADLVAERDGLRLQAQRKRWFSRKPKDTATV